MSLRETIRQRRNDLVAAALCIAAGIFISILPHLIEWWRSGNPVWIADYDDLDVYLLIASHAYHRHPAYLSDPYCPANGSYLPWLLIIPGVLITRLLGLPATYIGLVWRVIAGTGVGLTWFLIFRLYFRNRWFAVSLALFALFDAGTLDGRPLIEHLADFGRLYLASTAALLPHSMLPKISGPWRIMTPGLSWPFLLLYIWLAARAVRDQSRASIIWAGIGLGLCFSYFYYWTSAGLGLIIAILLDRQRWRTYFQIGCIGSLVGLPAFLGGLALKRQGNDQWLQRFDHFVPIRHFDELMFPKVAIICLAVILLWLLRSRRELIFLWSICAAALLLTNQQILTGQQMENWHWHYAWGPTLWLLIVLLVMGAVRERGNWSRSIAAAGLGLLAVIIATGLWMRGLEATRADESIQINEALRGFVPELDRNRAMFRTNQVVAGAQKMVSFLSIMNGDVPLWGYSVRLGSCIDNREWNYRAAADGYFRGMDRESFLREQEQVMAGERWGAWARSPELREAMVRERVADYDEVAANPDAAAKRFGVKYVVLPAGYDDRNLSVAWSQILSGPDWQAWERKAN